MHMIFFSGPEKELWKVGLYDSSVDYAPHEVTHEAEIKDVGNVIVNKTFGSVVIMVYKCTEHKDWIHKTVLW